MLTYNLDSYKPKPLYEALYECIRNDILSGIIKENEKLPSKRALSGHLNVSITTIENAYGQLQLEGYIRAEHGRGFFVNAIDLNNKSKNVQLPDPEPHQAPYIAAQPVDPIFLVDFKANSSFLTLFPMATRSRLMKNVLSSQDLKLLETVPYNGVLALREAIAEHLHSFRNMNVNPEQIIIGAGTEYLYSRLMGLFGPSSVVAIEDPGYKKFADISANHGIVWDYIPIDSYGMQIDRLQTSKAGIVHVSPAHHFPTGIVMPISRRLELLDWAKKENYRYIIEDDYDSELRYVGKMVPTMYSIDTNQKVIYMNTFSKSLVPSIRISYMVLPPMLLDRYRETLSFYSCTVSSFEQMTLAHFISEGYFERHINRLKQHYREKRDLLLKAITNSSLSKIMTIEEADAGTHFLLRVNTTMSDAQIKIVALMHQINFSMLSDYEKYHNLRNAHTIVINYAGLDSGKIDLAISIMEDIFKDDISHA